MKYSVYALGLEPREIDARGPYDAYLSYKEIIKPLIEDDFRYVVNFIEELCENSIYSHNFFFDNDGIIDHGLMADDKFKRQ